MTEATPILIGRRQHSRSVRVPAALGGSDHEIAHAANHRRWRIDDRVQGTQLRFDGRTIFIGGHAQLTNQRLDQALDLKQALAGLEQSIASRRASKALHVLKQQRHRVDVPDAAANPVSPLADSFDATRQMLQEGLTELGVLL